jgi:catechol 2,3-dioxygenase-like lactoylglutathione lyase family enzyme
MRLQHVGITVPPDGLERAREFYGATLGLRERPVASPERVAVFETGDPDLELHVVVGDRLPDPEAVHHFALETDELAELRSRLEAAGYEPLPSRPIDGRERFFVRDPFANFLELLAPAP